MIETQEAIKQTSMRCNLADVKELVDIGSVKIDQTLPREERVRSYLSQIKNPYCFKVGETVVKVKFSQTNLTMEECMNGYFSSL